MIPLWAKDRNGNWKLFPYHLLDTFEDGKQGFVFDGWGSRTNEKTQAFADFRDCFEPNPREDPKTAALLRFRYYLRGQP